MDGPRELPGTMLDYIEKHQSEYLAAPTVWNGPQKLNQRPCQTLGFETPASVLHARVASTG